MFGFGSKKNVFLGLDIGTSSIKMVEIKVEDKKPTLTNYAWMPLDNVAAKREGEDVYYGAILPACIKKMIKEAGFSGKNTYAALPAAGGLVTLIEFPKMADKDIEQAIRFEAQKYIPTSLDEVVLSWEIIGNRQNDKNNKSGKEDAVRDEAEPEKDKRLEIMLVAASKNKVQRYEALVKKTGLKLKSLELENFSMANSLIGNDGGRFIIADIGARVCNIMLVHNGIIGMNRNIDAGGKNITMTIAKSMGIDESRAERLKMSDKNYFNKESGLDFPTVDVIVSEIKRILTIAEKDSAGQSIDGVILSGGSANLTGIAEYMSERLGVKVVSGNAFGRVSYPKELEPAIESIKTEFSVAVGLAMKGLA